MANIKNMEPMLQNATKMLEGSGFRRHGKYYKNDG